MRLDANHVSFLYQQGTPFESKAVSDVTLTIDPGERVAIAGPVGSGKSTTLALIAGMLAPSTGEIAHDGRKLGRRSLPRPGSIGFAFQSPENSLFEKTVYDEIAFAPRVLRLGDEEVDGRVRAALTNVGLDPDKFGSRNPFTLSVGEQRRVALAGLLAMNPRAFLLDEPTAHLDPVSRRDITERLVRLNQETGATMIMVGHDMDEIACFADRLIIMDNGIVVADDDASRLLSDPVALESYSLELPGTVELCRLLAEMTGAEISPVLDEPGAVDLLLHFAHRVEGGS